MNKAPPQAPESPVTKHDFHTHMLKFKEKYPDPPPEDFDDVTYIRDFRALLDTLDRLSEQLPLRYQTIFFDLLASKPAIDYLLFLLSDVSVQSAHASNDARKIYRYPHLVAAILANGSMVVRDSFIDKPDLVDHLLTFLDGNVPLHSVAPAHNAESPRQPAELSYARNNPTIVTHIIQILVSYLDTSPDVLLRILHNRLGILHSLMGIMYISAIPKLFESFIPDLSLHQVSTTTLASSLTNSSSSSSSTTKLSFNKSMVYALNALAKVRVFHLLADTFYKVTINLHHYLNPKVIAAKSDRDRARELYRIKQYSHNITDVYESLVSKLIRAIRIHASNSSDTSPDSPSNSPSSSHQTLPQPNATPEIHACDYLNVYSTKDTADTIAKILRCGISLYFKAPKPTATTNSETPTSPAQQLELRETACVILNDGLTMLLRVLRVVQHDYSVRVASVTGPPRPLDTRPLENALHPLLNQLIYILVDAPSERSAALRIAILDALVELLRIAHADTATHIHNARFGAICLKLVAMHRGNSLIHHVVCRAVEDALVSKKSASADTVHHWLVKTDLLQWVMRVWTSLNGAENFRPNPSSSNGGTEKANIDRIRQAESLQTLLSTVVHMACCIHHYLAMQKELAASSVIPAETVAQFQAFWDDQLAHIVKTEKDTGAAKPKRKTMPGSLSSSSSSSSNSSSLGLTGQSSRAAKWSGALKTNYDSYPSEDELDAELTADLTTMSINSSSLSPKEDLIVDDSEDNCSNEAMTTGTKIKKVYIPGNLVRSDSAHRFGYIEPVNSLSRFDDVFDAGCDDFGHCDSVASLFDGNDGFG